MYEAGYRSLIKYSIFLLLLPLACWVINYSVGYVSGPTLYEGDALEVRNCRECCGKKTDPNFNPDGSLRPDVESAPQGGPDGPCPFCKGTGTVEVILPGLKRPTRLWGVVIDRKNAAEEINYSCPRNIAIVAFQAAFLPPERREIQGALPVARVLLVSDSAEAIETKTDAYGRFSTVVPPGNYRVKVSVPGFMTLEESLTVAPLTAPVWREKATSRSPDETAEESRSSMGLAIVLALGRTEEDHPFLRTYPVP